MVRLLKLAALLQVDNTKLKEFCSQESEEVLQVRRSTAETDLLHKLAMMSFARMRMLAHYMHAFQVP